MSQTDFEMQERIHKLAERIYVVEGHLPVIDRETQQAQWQAWRFWRKQHKQPVRVMDKRDRFTVLTEWPPGDFNELERRYAGRGKTARKLAG